MKHLKLFIIALFFAPTALFAANDFQNAAQLLLAAKNADIQQVQALVNAGADINFVDNTGLAVVCTALMNNDVRAAQILQMYGADASKCDQQIRKYNNKSPKKETGGLFSGLSSAQSISLAAAGAAVVVGGLLLLTDVIGPGNSNNNGSSGGGDRPGGDGGNGGGNGGGTVAITLPYGPAMPNAASETANYTKNLNFYSPSIAGILKDNFALMTNTYKQNYLLMMHGYSPLARGYMGMRTLRNTTNREPISLAGNNLGPDPVLGGRPVNVALVTANGVNAVEDSSLGDRLLPWTTTNANGTAANPASNDMISSKYYNNIINRGADNGTITDDTAVEDPTKLGDFDLSGSGSAINNPFAGASDNLLGKIVGGKDSGYTNGDFMGFMPNGQMTIFRTGGGKGMKTASGAVSGSFTDNGDGKWGTGDKVNLFGVELTITLNPATGAYAFSAVNAGGTTTYKGYRGADGLLYLDSNADGIIDQAYAIQTNNDLTFAKELGNIDYYNYKALLNGGAMWYAGDLAGGRSRPDILANASVIAPLRGKLTETISDVLSVAAPTDPDVMSKRQAFFSNLINKYYDRDTTDGTGGTNALPGSDAASFFGGLGSSYSPLVIFSTGSFETDSAFIGKTLEAGFENSAPLVFNNLEHLFMSVVAVGLTGTGTGGTGSVSGYSPSGKIALSQWTDQNGTPGDTSDDKYYKSRMCGVSGTGAKGIDPWCFSAAGVTDELAVASMAGAAGSIKSAFSYLTNKQLFALLALTADGPYLATKPDGKVMTVAELKAHLQAMYQMPNEQQERWEQGGEDYFKVFKEVFGYGLINLERATKPTSKIFYFDGDNIVSGNGNAYWRSASNTVFRASGAFNPRASSISAPFFDILTSVDGTLELPRIWQNEFALGTADIRGLYMGDVLGEFKIRKNDVQTIQTGNISFGMTFSEKSYSDNMNGLDNLQFGYTSGNFEFGASYQRHFTDGAGRFEGTTNPLFALTSNAVSSDVTYQMGNWSFGGRAFSGAITDESLLENDPTITSQYQPARLGLIQGAESNVGWGNDKFSVTAAFGTTHETDTVLGAQTGGLLDLGAGDTTYIDTVARYSPADDIVFSMRSTFAQTNSDARGEFILGLTGIESNAFSVGADFGNFSFTVSQPLAVTDGRMQYAYADYDVVENADGKFDLVVKDTHIADLDLTPEKRELRFTGSYRTTLGKYTDGAFGFIYRVNPNHIDEFGNESIFMMKISHRVGI